MRLGKALRLMRVTDHIGLREQAKLIGVSPATLSRIENGKACDSRSVLRLLTWLMSEESMK